jgi:hypothetical protein
MTAIERTAYPTFARAPQPKELLTLYTPEDVAFVSTTARGPNQKFALMILLKVFQKLGYFPAPQQIPGAIISHIRGVMKLPEDLEAVRKGLESHSTLLSFNWLPRSTHRSI